MQILDVLRERFLHHRGHAGIAAGGLHRVHRRGEGDRKFVQVMLELAIAAEAEPADDANDGGGVRLQPLRHRAHAQQNVFARMFQDRTNDFLTL